MGINTAPLPRFTVEFLYDNCITKMFSAQCARFSSILKMSRRNMGSYHPPASWRAPTLNDLPVPKGSWESAFKAQQSRYNILLAISVLYCFGSWAAVQGSGKIVWNWGPSMDGPMNVPTDAEIIADLEKRKAEQAEADE